MTWRVDLGDCAELMAAMEPCSVDAICTDPPYELGFMNRSWDRSGVSYQVSTWAEALRVLKPGGHLLAFGGTRTYHRLACAIEDAGFEIRDTIAYMYGSGFPKSLDVSKAIDKQAGAERKVVCYERSVWHPSGEGAVYEAAVTGDTRPVGEDGYQLKERTAPATPAAERWDGWGTALKPAHEPIVVARKPLAGTVTANVLEHGTGALNVDGCRIEGAPWVAHRASGLGTVKFFTEGDTPEIDKEPHALGRWPANVVLDEEAAAMLDEQSGPSTSRIGQPRQGQNGQGWGMTATGAEYGDSGGASRFFYCAKASRAERNAGLDGFEEKPWNDGRKVEADHPRLRGATGRGNHHPTVKPVQLMRWLVRLVTPPEGLVLDPFCGSGTTGVASVLEEFDFIGLERDPDYVPIARARIGWWAEHGQDALRIVAEQERAELERQAVKDSGQTDLFALLEEEA